MDNQNTRDRLMAKALDLAITEGVQAVTREALCVHANIRLHELNEVLGVRFSDFVTNLMGLYSAQPEKGRKRLPHGQRLSQIEKVREELQSLGGPVTNPMIADRLGVKPSTVSYHLRKVRGRSIHPP